MDLNVVFLINFQYFWCWFYLFIHQRSWFLLCLCSFNFCAHFLECQRQLLTLCPVVFATCCFMLLFLLLASITACCISMLFVNRLPSLCFLLHTSAPIPSWSLFSTLSLCARPSLWVPLVLFVRRLLSPPPHPPTLPFRSSLNSVNSSDSRGSSGSHSHSPSSSSSSSSSHQLFHHHHTRHRYRSSTLPQQTPARLSSISSHDSGFTSSSHDQYTSSKSSSPMPSETKVWMKDERENPSAGRTSHQKQCWLCSIICQWLLLRPGFKLSL